MCNTFVPGALVFITLRVSLPVYIARPTMLPDATTVLAQIVFSTLKGSTSGTAEPP